MDTCCFPLSASCRCCFYMQITLGNWRNGMQGMGRVAVDIRMVNLNISMKTIDFLETVWLATEGHLFPIADFRAWIGLGAAITSLRKLKYCRK